MSDDRIPWESLPVDFRQKIAERLAAILPGVDPLEHWDAMRGEDQRHLRWQAEHPGNAAGAYAAEVARISGGEDPATTAAYVRATMPALIVPDGWPELDPAALYGVAGDIVRELLPETEADPVALLFTVLTMAGASMGREAYALVGADQHPARLFVVLVGDTSTARKGTSLAESRRVMRTADDEFVDRHLLGGFASGEAVIDAAAELTDKRLLILEPEFARVLAVCRRDGSTLSHIIRAAWDGQRLEVRTRKRTQGTAVADDAHVGVLAHITVEELRAKLDETEQANGFANRHLFPVVRRSKLLPSGGNLDDEIPYTLGRTLAPILREARTRGILRRSPVAEKAWANLYCRLAAEETGGLLGAVTRRAAPQCLRLSVAYALLDRSVHIEPAHIEAAAAAWAYCADSARYIFGSSLGDPVADRLLAAVNAAGADGLDLTDRSRVFSGNVAAVHLDRATDRLLREGQIAKRSEPSDQNGGRPRTVLVATAHLST
jgi:hypothetical protein